MILKEKEIRESDVAFVLAKLRVRGRDYLLLNAHKKWGDWSLIGGHVEPWELGDWEAAAAREVSEEMAPLRCGEEVEIRALRVPESQWGPVNSRSAGGMLTRYRARWYTLWFKSDPERSLARLSTSEFRLVPIGDVAQMAHVSSVVLRAGEILPNGWASLPLAWEGNLAGSDLCAEPTSRLALV